MAVDPRLPDFFSGIFGSLCGRLRLTILYYGAGWGSSGRLTLFISHSSHDNEAAIRLRDWLRGNGWSQIFLDLDPEQGLAPGHRWKLELKKAGERCSGVVLLISPAWAASRWCQGEYELAENLGKRVFPVLIAPTAIEDLPIELRANYHFADISEPEREEDGLRRLAIGLRRAGLDPASFVWPPDFDPGRMIYRGLRVMEEADAAVFFGRDALITRGLDMLRQMRHGARERVLVVLGASGAGKSSFLRAGLMARLRRDDENFLVLPVVRPGRAAVSGPAGLAVALGVQPDSLVRPQALLELLEGRRRAEMERLTQLALVGRELPPELPPTIILAIDQAEELFSTENSEASKALDLLSAVIRHDSNILIIATIRSDRFEKFQEEPRLAGIPRIPFDLPAMPIGAFKEVIEGPARVADPPLSIDPALTERLLYDIETADALPLLALALQRLALNHREPGRLSLVDYSEDLGGLQGAVRGAVEAAFAAAAQDPALPGDRAQLEELARAAFIPWLVQLDDAEADPKRRIERLDSLPPQARPLIHHLVEQRLLVSDHRFSGDQQAEVIEVVHEAVLRQWPALRAWIAEERVALRDLDAVRAAAAEWQFHRRGDVPDLGGVWLAHRGHRLDDAEELTRRAGFAGALGPVERAYLLACRHAEDTRDHREREQIARTRRLQSRVGALIALAALVVAFAGIGIFELIGGLERRTAATLTSLAAASADSGNYDGAARYALAALNSADLPLLSSDSAPAEAELRGALNANRAVAAFHGHQGGVFGAEFSPDGTKIVTASNDKTAAIWDVATGRAMFVLRGHGGRVNTALFSPDGKRIVTTSVDGTARIWDSETGRTLLTLRGDGGQLARAALSPDGARIVTTSPDGGGIIWNAESGTVIARFSGHTDMVTQVAFSPDGRLIATSSLDKTARIWDGASGRPVAVLRGHEDYVRGVAFSPDGERLVTASDDTTARLWDVKTGHETLILRKHRERILAVAFDPDGSRVATASADRAVFLWDIATGRETEVLRGHADYVNSVSFSRDGKFIVTGSADQTARLWRVMPNEQITVLRGHDNWVLGAAFSDDGKKIVTASADATARIWDTDSGQPLLTLRGHQGMVAGADFSPDGKRVLTAGDDTTARIWDAADGHELLTLKGHADSVTRAVFSPAGDLIATSSQDGTARLWNANTGKEIVRLTGHQGWVDGVAFDPSAKRVATASTDGTVRLWNVADGRELAQIGQHPQGAIGTVGWSPDGGKLISAIDYQNAKIWNIATNREVFTLRGHEDRVYDAIYSPDGARIITTSDDRTARLWDGLTGRIIAVLRGHSDRVYHAAFTRNGDRVVTASHDRTARIWRIGGILNLDRDALVRRACAVDLALGLQKFSPEELRAAPVLDPALDEDPCHPSTIGARLRRIIWPQN
jgi:WD40 repeat protein